MKYHVVVHLKAITREDHSLHTNGFNKVVGLYDKVEMCPVWGGFYLRRDGDLYNTYFYWGDIHELQVFPVESPTPIPTSKFLSKW